MLSGSGWLSKSVIVWDPGQLREEVRDGWGFYPRNLEINFLFEEFGFIISKA